MNSDGQTLYRSFLGRLASILGTLLLAACSSSTANSLSTTTPPDQPIVTFPNSYDARWNTVISSEPFVTQAGIDGRTLTVAVFHGAERVSNNLTIDFDGNLGIRGVFKSVSTRKAKWDIRPYRDNALAVLHDLPISTFLYRGEDRSEPPHIGFIAEDAPAVLAGTKHDSFNLNNSVGLTMAATKQLNDRVELLSKRVVDLERLVSQLRAERNANRATGSAR